MKLFPHHVIGADCTVIHRLMGRAFSLCEAEVTKIGHTDSTRQCEVTALGECAWGRFRAEERACLRPTIDDVWLAAARF